MIKDIFCRVKGIELTGQNIIRAMIFFLIIITLILWIRMPRFGRKIESQLSIDYVFIGKSVENIDEKEVTIYRYGRNKNEEDFEIICPKGERLSYKVVLKSGRKFQIVNGNISELINEKRVSVDIGKSFEDEEIALYMFLHNIKESDGIKIAMFIILILCNTIGAFLALKPKTAIAFRNIGMFKSYEPSDLNVFGTIAFGFLIIIFGMFSIMRF